MASSSSWFARSPSSKQDYELPRWQTPLSMGASIIPPPIVQSTYKQSPKLSTVLPTQSVILEKPPATANRESELQADLQFLLDAQAEGLIRGLEGGLDDTSSHGSSTPIARQPRQIARPVRRRLGLRSARKGIYSCILSLAEIKSEEIASVGRTLRHRADTIERIDLWEEKRERLEKATTTANNDEENVRVQRLQQEGEALQDEINRVELQLMELKSKRRKVLKQAAAIENAVQAKLASYTTSLNLLESEIKTFLSAQPSQDFKSLQILDGKQSVWQLPRDRRTLALAKQQLNAEKLEVEEQSKELQFESQALQEGADMWKDVVSQITHFEKSLRSEMTHLSDSTIAWDDTPQPTTPERFAGVYKHMQDLVANLEKQLKHAEDCNWRLLIAAIGAELDALQRGKQILDGIVGTHAGEDIKKRENGDLVSTATQEEPRQRQSNGRSDTDDEPDPELLFSVQDEDDAEE